MAIAYRAMQGSPVSQERSSEPLGSRQDTVERAENYLRAHLDTHVPLPRLCRVVGVSERSLRNAFYAVHGIGPKRWMLAERLEGVRRALRAVGSASITITDVAIDHGFNELGRFAGRYRAAFGETPSQTRRDSGRKPSTTTKGHAHA
jgi:transcriptional regulator GlxA family with amidase domain